MQVMEDKKEVIEQFANKSPCICFNLRKAARAITQIYDKMFKEAGLTSSQAAILTSTRMIGPMTVTQLAEAMATDRTTITRNLKPLERDGLITIQPGQNDKREREVVITQKGEEISLKTFEIWQKFQDKVNKTVGEEKMHKICKELSQAMGQIQNL